MSINLRDFFNNMPNDGDNRSFVIRLHRALSWLEEAERASEKEPRFIYRWIAFNTLYGQSREGLPVGQFADNGERQDYIDFLHRMARLDRVGILASLKPIQHFVRRMVGFQYLYSGYWRQQPDWQQALLRDQNSVLPFLSNGQLDRLLPLVFDRLYTLRLQLFHGAATFGSRVNRVSLNMADLVMSPLLPAIVGAMMKHGGNEDWGEISYPPRDQ